MPLADRLADKAKEYELNALAAEERGDVSAASLFSTVAVALYEVAAAEREAEREAA